MRAPRAPKSPSKRREHYASIVSSIDNLLRERNGFETNWFRTEDIEAFRGARNDYRRLRRAEKELESMSVEATSNQTDVTPAINLTSPNEKDLESISVEAISNQSDAIPVNNVIYPNQQSSRRSFHDPTVTRHTTSTNCHENRRTPPIETLHSSVEAISNQSDEIPVNNVISSNEQSSRRSSHDPTVTRHTPSTNRHENRRTPPIETLRPDNEEVDPSCSNCQRKNCNELGNLSSRRL